jgi:hypothetical protein
VRRPRSRAGRTGGSWYGSYKYVYVDKDGKTWSTDKTNLARAKKHAMQDLRSGEAVRVTIEDGNTGKVIWERPKGKKVSEQLAEAVGFQAAGTRRPTARITKGVLQGMRRLVLRGAQEVERTVGPEVEILAVPDGKRVGYSVSVKGEPGPKKYTSISAILQWLIQAGRVVKEDEDTA